jgi:DNA-binding transcriptional LysR family regulator
MELRQLRYFVAVAEELHFRRAAERLHVAQPGLSQQIRTLERELGVRLLDRDRRSVALTPAGTALLQDARELLAGAERARGRAQAAGAGLIGRLRLSLTQSLTGGLAGRIVDRYRELYPQVEVELGVGYTSLHIEQLLAARLDVAFIRTPLNEPALAELELAREPLVCVLPGSHALARKRRITRADVAGEPLAWWPREHGPGPWDAMLDEVYGPGERPPIVRTEPAEERFLAAVADGAGISLTMLERSRMMRIPGTVVRRFQAPEPTVGIGLAWRRDAPLPAIERLCDVAVGVVEGERPPGTQEPPLPLELR